MTGLRTTRTNPLCVALDTPSPDDARALAASLAGEVGAFKVGLTAFSVGGPELVRDVARRGEVFLDLKLHDIPAQVEGAVRALAQLDAALTTVHALGGQAMLRAAADAAQGSDLKLVAVTILTSLDQPDLDTAGIAGPVPQAVLRLAETALGCGLDGLVCSALEVPLVRDRFGAFEDGGPYLVVPGIRPAGAAGDDQRRTMTPREAVEAGADLLVVGRPITGALDPVGAAREIAAGL